ncbi:unnamed protein product, partial [Nippostrongylus brasiliensis]|uniref:Muscle m-line assembly protein unc-89 n=1 Tax=Nippostrongylus brasiliensis TaxID=27835 RepID=A0A0N4Y2G1_NIPBR
LPAEEIGGPPSKKPTVPPTKAAPTKTPEANKPAAKAPPKEPEAKKPLKVKPTEDEPEADFTLPLKKKPAGDVTDDLELPAEEIGKKPTVPPTKTAPPKTPGASKPSAKAPPKEPEAKKPLKVKPSEDEPDADFTMPLKKKPAGDVELPAEEIEGPTPKKPTVPPTKAAPTKTPEASKPAAKAQPKVPEAKKPLKVKPTEDEPEADFTLPLKKEPTDDLELPAEEIGGPTPKKPTVPPTKAAPAKTPEASKPAAKASPKVPEAKKPLKVKPTEDEPEADFTLPLKKKPAGDVEPLAEEIGGPTPKKPTVPPTKAAPPKAPESGKPAAKAQPKEPEGKKPLKVKPSDDEPDADFTMPLKKKPTDEDELPAEEIGGPPSKKPDPSARPKKPESKKPLKLKPSDDEPDADFTVPLSTNDTPCDENEPPTDDIGEASPEEDEPDEITPRPAKKKPLKVKQPGEDPEADFTIPSPKQKKHKKKPKEKDPLPKKPTWVPPIKAQEPIPMPPKEPTLAERNKEERIPPTRRYAKKPRSHEVYIPFVIPWEQTPALITQEGMGAFGKPRDANIKVSQGSKELKQGALESETVLPLLNDRRGLANRSGMLPFGNRRLNVGSTVDNHNYQMPSDSTSEGIIPLLSRGAQQQGHLSASNLRPQVLTLAFSVPVIAYSDNMEPDMDKMSHGFVSRYFKPTSKQKAGTHIIDRRRGEIAPCGLQRLESEGMIPMMFDGRAVMQKEGSDFGSFRPLIASSTGGYLMTYDEELLCKMAIPFQEIAYGNVHLDPFADSIALLAYSEDDLQVRDAKMVLDWCFNSGIIYMGYIGNDDDIEERPRLRDVY